MNVAPDRLLVCSTPGCPELVYLNESTHWSKLEDAPPGRYCHPCAAQYQRKAPPLTQGQLDRLLGSLLRSAGMLQATGSLKGTCPPRETATKTGGTSRRVVGGETSPHPSFPLT